MIVVAVGWDPFFAAYNQYGLIKQAVLMGFRTGRNIQQYVVVFGRGLHIRDNGMK